jgi:hypothetical protein
VAGSTAKHTLSAKATIGRSSGHHLAEGWRTFAVDAKKEGKSTELEIGFREEHACRYHFLHTTPTRATFNGAGRSSVCSRHLENSVPRWLRLVPGESSHFASAHAKIKATPPIALSVLAVRRLSCFQLGLRSHPLLHLRPVTGIHSHAHSPFAFWPTLRSFDTLPLRVACVLSSITQSLFKIAPAP